MDLHNTKEDKDLASTDLRQSRQLTDGTNSLGSFLAPAVNTHTQAYRTQGVGHYRHINLVKGKHRGRVSLLDKNCYLGAKFSSFPGYTIRVTCLPGFHFLTCKMKTRIIPKLTLMHNV